MKFNLLQGLILDVGFKLFNLDPIPKRKNIFLVKLIDLLMRSYTDLSSACRCPATRDDIYITKQTPQRDDPATR